MKREKAERIVSYLDAALTALTDLSVVQEKIGQAIAALEVGIALDEYSDAEELDFSEDVILPPLYEDDEDDM